MKIFSTLCALALSSSVVVTAMVPAQAQMISRPAVATNVAEQPIQVQSNIERRIRREIRRDVRRDVRRDARREARRDYYRNNNGYVYNGYRGYRDYRPGYRRYRDAWFPSAAFVTGAIIGGAIAAQPAPVVRRSSGNAHVSWCYDRYRSYRASDNTFQPYNGPRQQCYSPYS